MFYIPTVLKNRGPLSAIWILAHFPKQLQIRKILEIDVSATLNIVIDNRNSFSLELVNTLLLGISVAIKCQVHHIESRLNFIFHKLFKNQKLNQSSSRRTMFLSTEPIELALEENELPESIPNLEAFEAITEDNLVERSRLNTIKEYLPPPYQENEFLPEDYFGDSNQNSMFEGIEDLFDSSRRQSIEPTQPVPIVPMDIEMQVDPCNETGLETTLLDAQFPVQQIQNEPEPHETISFELESAPSKKKTQRRQPFQRNRRRRRPRINEYSQINVRNRFNSPTIDSLIKDLVLSRNEPYWFTEPYHSLLSCLGKYYHRGCHSQAIDENEQLEHQIELEPQQIHGSPELFPSEIIGDNFEEISPVVRDKPIIDFSKVTIPGQTADYISDIVETYEPIPEAITEQEFEPHRESFENLISFEPDMYPQLIEACDKITNKTEFADFFSKVLALESANYITTTQVMPNQVKIELVSNIQDQL